MRDRPRDLRGSVLLQQPEERCAAPAAAEVGELLQRPQRRECQLASGRLPPGRHAAMPSRQVLVWPRALGKVAQDDPACCVE